jgi:hypothetical protein
MKNTSFVDFNTALIIVDSIKSKWCNENNIKLFRISYKEKCQIFDILNKKLLSL